MLWCPVGFECVVPRTRKWVFGKSKVEGKVLNGTGIVWLKPKTFCIRSLDIFCNWLLLPAHALAKAMFLFECKQWENVCFVSHRIISKSLSRSQINGLNCHKTLLLFENTWKILRTLPCYLYFLNISYVLKSLPCLMIVLIPLASWLVK